MGEQAVAKDKCTGRVIGESALVKPRGAPDREIVDRAPEAANTGLSHPPPARDREGHVWPEDEDQPGGDDPIQRLEGGLGLLSPLRGYLELLSLLDTSETVWLK